MNSKKQVARHKQAAMEKRQVHLVLHNVRSAYNVGAIFRTAECAGVVKIFLTGYTPAPADRFGRVQKDIAKTALGAEKSVLWEQVTRGIALFARLKKDGVTTVVLEQAPRAIDYKKFTPRYPMALVVGNEVRGVSPALLKRCDVVVAIPLRGMKESLNVSVAAGVALFRILDV